MTGKVEIVTFSSTLMHYAKAVGKARMHGTPEELAEAEKKLKEYEDLVRISDKFQINLPQPHHKRNNWPSF